MRERERESITDRHSVRAPRHHVHLTSPDFPCHCSGPKTTVPHNWSNSFILPRPVRMFPAGQPVAGHFDTITSLPCVVSPLQGSCCWEDAIGRPLVGQLL